MSGHHVLLRKSCHGYILDIASSLTQRLDPYREALTFETNLPTILLWGFY